MVVLDGCFSHFLWTKNQTNSPKDNIKSNKPLTTFLGADIMGRNNMYCLPATFR